MFKVYRRINRFFRPYAVDIQFEGPPDIRADGTTYQVRLYKKDALKLIEDIQEALREED